MPFALVTRGFTGKLLHFLKLIEVPHDKTQFRLVIGPKVSKGKMSQLKMNAIKRQQFTNVLKGLFNKTFCKKRSSVIHNIPCKHQAPC